jgi:hypothetical protein
MEYAIPVVLVLIIVSVAIGAFVVNSRHRTSEDGRDLFAADEKRTGGPGTGADATPLGDTAEHAGRQSDTGRTVSPPDAERFGGTGRPLDHYGATVPEDRGRLDHRDDAS